MARRAFLQEQRSGLDPGVGVEALDLVQLHWWDYRVPGWIEAAQALDDLRRAGKVRHVALTNFDTLRVRAIVALTESGFTARSISKYRPRSPILGVTRWERVMRRFAMNWGVTGVRFEGSEPTDSAMTAFAIQRARELGEQTVQKLAK